MILTTRVPRTLQASMPTLWLRMVFGIEMRWHLEIFFSIGYTVLSLTCIIYLRMSSYDKSVSRYASPASCIFKTMFDSVVQASQHY